MSWPSVMESFCIALTSMIDSFMVSSYGTYAVSAIGLAAQPRYMGLAFFIVVNVGVSALVSRRKGENKREEANKVLLAALIITIAAGFIVSIACVVFTGDIIRLSGSSKDTHESAVIYFKIIMGFMMFHIVSLVINAAQRGVGNTKIAMRTNIASNIIHITGNLYRLSSGRRRYFIYHDGIFDQCNDYKNWFFLFFLLCGRLWIDWNMVWNTCGSIYKIYADVFSL